jgi:formylmethanofuran dehydrogenase subunit A
MAMPLKVNGVPIKNPSSFKISHYNITKAGRVASGEMTMELVAKKRKFFFEYKAINSIDKKAIMDVIDTNEMFFTLEYVEDGENKSATVYVGEIPRERFRTDGSVWYWKNFNFNLIEK